MIIVIGIFIAIEPKLYDRGVAWMLPVEQSRPLLRISEQGRLHAAPADVRADRRHGVRRRRHLADADVGRRADGGAARPADRPARLHPQYRRDHLGRADGRGRLFGRARDAGLWAIFVYFFVQNVDGYLVVPYVARRTVDLAPALVLAAQLLFGALFGILGLLLADPIVATIKVSLENGRSDAPDVETTSKPTSAPATPAKRLARSAAELRPAATAPAVLLRRRSARRCGTTWTTWTSKYRSSLGLIGLPRRRVGAIGEPARDDDLVAAALLHLQQRLAEAGDDLLTRNRRRAAAFGGVEHRAVLGPAGIFDDHPVQLGRAGRRLPAATVSTSSVLNWPAPK